MTLDTFKFLTRDTDIFVTKYVMEQRGSEYIEYNTYPMESKNLHKIQENLVLNKGSYNITLVFDKIIYEDNTLKVYYKPQPND